MIIRIVYRTLLLSFLNPNDNAQTIQTTNPHFHESLQISFATALLYSHPRPQTVIQTAISKPRCCKREHQRRKSMPKEGHDTSFVLKIHRPSILVEPAALVALAGPLVSLASHRASHSVPASLLATPVPPPAPTASIARPTSPASQMPAALSPTS